jgi:hypothetical protein
MVLITTAPRGSARVSFSMQVRCDVCHDALARLILGVIFVFQLERALYVLFPKDLFQVSATMRDWERDYMAYGLIHDVGMIRWSLRAASESRSVLCVRIQVESDADCSRVNLSTEFQFEFQCLELFYHIQSCTTDIFMYL